MCERAPLLLCFLHPFSRPPTNHCFLFALAAFLLLFEPPFFACAASVLACCSSTNPVSRLPLWRVCTPCLDHLCVCVIVCGRLSVCLSSQALLVLVVVSLLRLSVCEPCMFRSFVLVNHHLTSFYTYARIQEKAYRGRGSAKTCWSRAIRRVPAESHRRVI